MPKHDSISTDRSIIRPRSKQGDRPLAKQVDCLLLSRNLLYQVAYQTRLCFTQSFIIRSSRWCRTNTRVRNSLYLYCAPDSQDVCFRPRWLCQPQLPIPPCYKLYDIFQHTRPGLLPNCSPPLQDPSLQPPSCSPLYLLLLSPSANETLVIPTHIRNTTHPYAVTPEDDSKLSIVATALRLRDSKGQTGRLYHLGQTGRMADSRRSRYQYAEEEPRC